LSGEEEQLHAGTACRRPTNETEIENEIKTCIWMPGPQFERSFCQEATHKLGEVQEVRGRVARHCHCFHANKQMSKQIAGASGSAKKGQELGALGMGYYRSCC